METKFISSLSRFCSLALRPFLICLVLLDWSNVFGQTINITSDKSGVTLRAGDVVTYTVVATNNTAFKITGASISDPIAGVSPAVLVPNSLLVSGTSMTCSVPTYTTAISLSGFNLLPFESINYRFQLKVPAGYSGTGSVAHTATFGAASDTETNAVSAIPTLAIVKAGATDVTTGTVNLKGRIEYTITVTNTGNATANAVVVDDVFDTDVALMTANNVRVTQSYVGTYAVNNGNDAAHTKVNVSLGNIPSGGVATIKFEVLLKTGATGPITNMASVTSSNLTGGVSSGSVNSNTVSHTINAGSSCANRNVYYLSYNGSNGTAVVNNPSKPWQSFKVIIDLINAAGGNAVVRFLDSYYPTSVSGTTNPILSTPCVTIDGNYCVFDRNSGGSVGFLEIANGANGDTIRNLRLTNFNKSPNCSFDIIGTSPASPITGLVVEDVDIYATQSVKATNFVNVSGAKFVDCDWANNPFGAIDIVDAKITFTNCTWSCNTRGGFGGAINAKIKSGGGSSDAHFTDLKFMGCRFSGNSGTGGAADGGAIYMGCGTLAIDDTEFNCNTSDASSGTAGGGAIRLSSESGSSGKPVSNISNSVFFNNSVSTSTEGGAILQGSAGLLTLNNCIFQDNVSGNGSALHTNANCVINNCYFEGNTTSAAIVGSPSLVDSTTIKGNGAGVSGTIGTLSNSLVCGNTGTNISAHPTTTTNSLYGTSAEAVNNAIVTTTNDASSQTAGYTFTNNTYSQHSLNNGTTLAASGLQTAYTGTTLTEAAYANNADAQGTAEFNGGVSQIASGGNSGGYWSIATNTPYTNSCDAQGTATFGTGVTLNTGGGISGDYFRLSSTGYLIVPLDGLDLSKSSSAQVTYNTLSINNTGNATSNIRIEVSSDGGTSWTAAVSTSTTTSTAWTARTLAITGLTNNMQLRFSKVTAANDDVGVDNISIQQAGYLEVPIATDLTGLSNVNVQYFKKDIDGGNGTSSNVRIEVSSDGGSTWTAATAQSTATTASWAATTALSITTLSNNMRLRFSKVTLLGDNVGVDDISVTYSNPSVNAGGYWLLDPAEAVTSSSNITLASYPNARVSFDVASIGNHGINPSGTFEYSTNGGTSYTTITALAPTSNSFTTLGPFSITPDLTTQLRFRFTNSNAQNSLVNGLAIDNVKIEYDLNIQQATTGDGAAAGYWLAEKNDVITSGDIDLTGLNNVKVQFRAATFGTVASAGAPVFEYSLNGGSTWTTATGITNPTSSTYVFGFGGASSTPFSIGSPNVNNFRFRLSNPAALVGGNGIRFDNIAILYDQPITCSSTTVGSDLTIGTYACLGSCPANPAAADICATFDLGHISLASGCNFLNTYTGDFALNTPVTFQPGQSITANVHRFAYNTSVPNPYQWRWLVTNSSGEIMQLATPSNHTTGISNTVITPSFTPVPGTYRVYGYYFNPNKISVPITGSNISALTNECGSLSKTFATFEVLKPIVITLATACADNDIQTCGYRVVSTVNVTGGYPEYASSNGIYAPQYILGNDSSYTSSWSNEMEGWATYNTPTKFVDGYVDGSGFASKVTDDGNCTTYPFALSTEVSATPSICTTKVAGNAYYDANAATIDGTGINKLTSTTREEPFQLYAYLWSTGATPSVVSRALVSPSGGFTFTNGFSPDENYQLILSVDSLGLASTATDISSIVGTTTMPDATPPPGWSNTAEGTYNTLGDVSAGGIAGGTNSRLALSVIGAGDYLAGNDFGLISVNLSGALFHDVNGLEDGSINGAAYPGTDMYAILYDETQSKVVGKTNFTAGGYLFKGVAPSNYSVVIVNATTANLRLRDGSAAPVLINAIEYGDPLPSASLPSSQWVVVGEVGGGSSAPDGSSNGQISGVSVVATNVIDRNFGIQQLPTSTDGTETVATNPGGTVNQSVTNTWMPTSDYAGGSVSLVNIPTFPSNVADITIGGITYTSGTWPAGGVTFNPNPSSVTLVNFPGNVSGNFTIGSTTYTAATWPGGGVTIPAGTVTFDPVDGNINVPIPFSPIDNAGFKSTSPSTLNVTFGTLPIELVYFSGATLNCNANKLSWATATEENVSHFSIQRSTNAVDFTEVGTVNAAGNSNSAIEYAWIDQGVEGNAYYKLVSVDHDGSLQESHIVFLTSPCGDELDFAVGPIPAKGDIKVTFPTYDFTGKSGEFEVVDILGRVISKQSRVLRNSMSFDITHLTKGSYFLRLNVDGVVRVKKFVVY